MIDAFQGLWLAEAVSPLQVRFADTEAQKKLKSLFSKKKAFPRYDDSLNLERVRFNF
jgi:hypothetical protein